MSQLAHPDVAYVADVLETIGQKYRLQQLARGVLLSTATMLPLSLLAGWGAHFAGAGTFSLLILFTWVILFAAAVWIWILKPFFIRPRLEWIARYTESRVEGLHNCFTNAVRLSQRDDVQASQFTPLIYEEIRRTVDSHPVSAAVRMDDLTRVGMRCLACIAISVIGFLLGHRQIVHGWQQMASPGTFVPNRSSVEIISVLPGDTSIVRGQPLEIVAEVKQETDQQVPYATLIVDPLMSGRSEIELSKISENRFGYRIPRLDAYQRYRVEVGGTQSRWYEVKVVYKINLIGLNLGIEPPAYTGLKNERIDYEPQSPASVTVNQGSKINLTARIDQSVSAAMLQVDNLPPLAMRRENDGKQYACEFVPNQNASVVILLVDGSGQTIAKLPESPVEIKVQPDLPPAIRMIYPNQDLKTSIDAKLQIAANLSDDIGLSSASMLVGIGSSAEMSNIYSAELKGAANYKIEKVLAIRKDQVFHGQVIRVQVIANDHRNLPGDQGPQTSRSSIFQITLEDPAKLANELKSEIDQLRKHLEEMLERQKSAYSRTGAMKYLKSLGTIPADQQWIQRKMSDVAAGFHFQPSDVNMQKTLLMLAKNPAQQAIDLCASIQKEPDSDVIISQHRELLSQQRVIISTIESLLSILKKTQTLVESKKTRGGDLPHAKEAIETLKTALREYMKMQQKILDQTAPLAKKSVDDFSEAEKKLLQELTMSQEKLDSFMQEKVSDFSKLAEQDMSNSSLLRELLEVYSEVTAAKDALKQQKTEIAVAAEEMGLESARELESNIEKWLPNTPDQVKWDQEDPLTKTDLPMAELPKELEDMIGELMEEQEDLLEEAEDANANWTDSIDKGAGWDALDGPIANMSAKGVTGNNLPNNNEMGGRSGEGRSGKSQGEFVEESATGKGGRNTPTRLDPTSFQKGQINDQSKDPTGGATGGGKIAGQGGEGLEGPVAASIQQQLKRLAQKQAQIRNTAERLNLQYKLGRYDNFKLLESIAIMRRIEASFDANRYENAMYRKDALLENLQTSQMLLGGELHVQNDSSPVVSKKLDDQIKDAMKGELPPTWREVLKTYYQKIGQ